ncbi:sulfite exporter TauE/SafE family protein [Catelliglobosispora koreensis]|uniref:sulfite exporter TauE/SafE family protein n=1 Tax=Catelliglobosispora koreensis TaxID=129052 RepID=UPI000372D68D|nr:sulfite exporter TauE/SafE family protein [Catelliglobosispora koreensis]
MTAGVLLALAAALIVGLMLGGLGGGGSILAVPVLVYLAGIDPKPAIAMSLVVVGVTAAVALIPHARAGRVHWRTGLLFGGFGMAGAYAGGRIAAYLPAAVLLAGLAVMMLLTAVAMLRPSRTAPPTAAVRRRPLAKIAVEGTAVGLITGLVGAGGGFLVVPALVLLGGLSMPAAIGTSLLVISLKSGAALAGYLHSVAIDWPLTLSVTALAVAGSLIGARLAGRINPSALRRGFGWFVIVMGLGVLTGQLLA